MSLPTRDNLLALDWSSNGAPFVKVASKSGIALDGLDWSANGGPWWGLIVTAAGWSGKVYDVAIEKIYGIVKEDVATVSGV